MLPAMHPVARKVDADKSNNIRKPCCMDMRDSDFAHQPAVGNDCDTQSQHIFGDIGNTAAEAANHIHVAKSIFAFIPSVPLFKKDKEQESRHCDQQYFTVSFHITIISYSNLQKVQYRKKYRTLTQAKVVDLIFVKTNG